MAQPTLNPYEAPRSTSKENQPNWWKRSCLGGLIVMVAAALLLCASAEFRGSSVVFLRANQALLLASLCAGGAATFAIGGLGWLLRTLQRRSLTP